MGQALAVRSDFTSGAIRRLAQRARNAAQARRLLAIAAILDGASRGEAASEERSVRPCVWPISAVHVRLQPVGSGSRGRRPSQDILCRWMAVHSIIILPRLQGQRSQCELFDWQAGDDQCGDEGVECNID